MKEKRITVVTDDKIHKAVRVKAAKEGRTIKQVANELFKKWLKNGEKTC
jgi:plasmid stability protein